MGLRSFCLVTFRRAAVSQDEGVLAAEGLVKALQLEAFDCRQFENPVLQRYGQHVHHIIYVYTVALASGKPSFRV